ncbi:hypothetical protein A3A64_04330 [Candidatus Gottesmanbacteria bacterium RIFCSPLOWO2_01_FULL_48_11]|uniref:Glycosyltransferase RgtA/B/C/D-like domain-containing protein n=1 Tax=Candidatus Gottesmanbacteria bacterium RIFCSPLOWO2_01_FULL_48_11 TaxID=1798395 RepID=A0A1F6AUY1_9BACT|nr:MAG: hypothetical protein A3A64_04330 [Candidatus Gottesmanbacteria bacterium RIFCSPLOWO2_01_FULL_48_11]
MSALVAPLVLMYGRILKTWKHLPVVAVVALTPFLLDLSADGSNDNSAIFLLLAALALFVRGTVKKLDKATVLSAIVLGLAASFKHYMAFFLIFFLPYIIGKRMWRYLGIFFGDSGRRKFAICDGVSCRIFPQSFLY